MCRNKYFECKFLHLFFWLIESLLRAMMGRRDLRKKILIRFGENFYILLYDKCSFCNLDCLIRKNKNVFCVIWFENSFFFILLFHFRLEWVATRFVLAQVLWVIRKIIFMSLTHYESLSMLTIIMFIVIVNKCITTNY